LSFDGKLYLTNKLNTREERYYIEPSIPNLVMVEVMGYKYMDYAYGDYSSWCKREESSGYQEDYTILGENILSFGSDSGVIAKRDEKMRVAVEDALQNNNYLKENESISAKSYSDEFSNERYERKNTQSKKNIDLEM